MKRNETIDLARFAGVVSILTGGILLCSILFQQMALYILHNGLPTIHR
jgi:hypothetical protein